MENITKVSSSSTPSHTNISPVQTICMICQQRLLINNIEPFEREAFEREAFEREAFEGEAFNYDETNNNTLVETIICKPCIICNYYVHKPCWTEYIRNKQINSQPIECLTDKSHILTNIYNIQYNPTQNLPPIQLTIYSRNSRRRIHTENIDHDFIRYYFIPQNDTIIENTRQPCFIGYLLFSFFYFYFVISAYLDELPREDIRFIYTLNYIFISILLFYEVTINSRWSLDNSGNDLNCSSNPRFLNIRVISGISIIQFIIMLVITANTNVQSQFLTIMIIDYIQFSIIIYFSCFKREVIGERTLDNPELIV